MPNKPTDSIYCNFAELYTKHVNLSKKKLELEQEIKTKLKTQNLLKTALNLKKKEIFSKSGKEIPKDLVFTLNKGNELFFELIDIGRYADSDIDKFHNKEFIYPIGYKSRRIFQSYIQNNYTKMTYICEIQKDGFKIQSEDGKEWTGINIWTEFSKCFTSFEFKNIEHFFGLTYKPIQAKIEKLGDITPFVDYVKMDERKGK